MHNVIVMKILDAVEYLQQYDCSFNFMKLASLEREEGEKIATGEQLLEYISEVINILLW